MPFTIPFNRDRWQTLQTKFLVTICQNYMKKYIYQIVFAKVLCIITINLKLFCKINFHISMWKGLNTYYVMCAKVNHKMVSYDLIIRAGVYFVGWQTYMTKCGGEKVFKWTSRILYFLDYPEGFKELPNQCFCWYISFVWNVSYNCMDHWSLFHRTPPFLRWKIKDYSFKHEIFQMIFFYLL